MLRKQNKLLARQAVGEVLRSRLFWLMVAGGVVLDLARGGTWLLYLAGAVLLFLLVLGTLFPRPYLFLPPDPEWWTYWETRKLREEVRRLRRGR
ncbi:MULTISPECIES: hypothetical protein [Thermus]|uniref:Uncharacterized protein n=2 Tax=Thermus TaxID=270 RepID=A0A4Q9AY28_9DEIN|nr:MULTISPECIES: hypothetical protein [Thermus]TBH16581.1 hypothetical protein ETP66_10110 [Thermus thermamylovorans]TFU26298.1 hypothetical protein E0687_06800 [Thermus tengchongensis]